MISLQAAPAKTFHTNVLGPAWGTRAGLSPLFSMALFLMGVVGSYIVCFQMTQSNMVLRRLKTDKETAPPPTQSGLLRVQHDESVRI